MMQGSRLAATTFEVAFARFKRDAQEFMDAHCARYKRPPKSLRFTRGRHLIRVSATEKGFDYVFCFVDVRSGDIRRAIRWDRAGKPQQNIYTYEKLFASEGDRGLRVI